MNHVKERRFTIVRKAQPVKLDFELRRVVAALAELYAKAEQAGLVTEPPPSIHELMDGWRR